MQSGARLSRSSSKSKQEEPKKQEEVKVPEPEKKPIPAKPEKPAESRVPKEKFVISSQLPTLPETPVVEVSQTTETPVAKESQTPEVPEIEHEVKVEQPVEKISLELPVINEINDLPDFKRDLKEEITLPSKVMKKKPQSFKVNFTLPQISRPRIKVPGVSQGKLLSAVIVLIVVGIVGAVGALLYIESQPSTGKALSTAKELLANAQTMTFTLNSSFDLKSIPTDEDILKGATETDTIIVYQATGKYNKVTREMDIEGEYQSMGESLAYKQTSIANDVYIKYSERDYIKGDIGDSILTIQDIESQNLYSKLSDDTRFGFGAEEMIGGENTYRFRAYPTNDQLNEYLVNFLGGIVKKLYPLNPPVITADDLSFTNTGYRLWVTLATYKPVKLQMQYSGVEIDLGSKGRIVITDLRTDLLISSINQSVIIEAPI